MRWLAGRLHGVGALAVVIAASLLGGCFEGGPLGAGDVGVDLPQFELPPSDTALPDTALPDTAPDPGVDPGPELPPPDATSCQNDDVCAPLSNDMCLGQMRCIGGYCQHDPTLAVVCTDDGNECTNEACDPATGLCETTPVTGGDCVCKPKSQLVCGSVVTQSTADLGETDVMGNYICGPPGGTAAEHTFLFTTDTTQIVSVSAQSAEDGGVYVLGYDGTQCVSEACVAGGVSGAAFEAQAGFDYAVIYEHPEGLPVQFTLQVNCGITNEFSCNNGVDDDLNALTDCDDPFCADKPACVGQPESACDDGVDNDNDSLTDCADADCSLVAACDQSCDAVVATSCGQSYSISTGGGKTDATDYSCGTPSAGKEVAYILPSGVSGQVTVTLTSGLPHRLYILQDFGNGCSPFNCLQETTTSVTVDKPAGTTWYAVIDADEGVEGPFTIDIDCQ